MSRFDKYLTDHAEQAERELCEFLRIASISADSRHQSDVRKAAEWVGGQFRRIEFATEIIETGGHPIVFSESPPIAGAPVVLVYGHYDVQPPDPLNEWITPPFEPTIRGRNVFARGATDDKGQMLTHVKGAEAWIKTAGRAPVQLKFLIEGEEEIGSAHLTSFIETQRDRLKCDVVVVSDTSQFGPGQPAITYGLRGIAYYELRLKGPAQDKHSGVFGGAVANPAIALSQMLSALIDDAGRIQIPGFYDDVAPLADSERAQLRSLPFDEKRFMEQLGVTALRGEEGYSTLERRWARPSFDINGLASGYQGEGAKTVLPAQAMAKFSFRLVPNQRPGKVTEQLRTFLEPRCPGGIRMELIDFHGAPAAVVPLDSPYISAAARAIERGFGKKPVFMREGGTIPVVNTFKELLGVDTLLLGWGLDDDNPHGPNEKFSLDDFQRGIKASACLWEELAALGSSANKNANKD